MLAASTDRQAAFGFNVCAAYGQGRQHLRNGAYQFGNAFAIFALAMLALPADSKTWLAAEVAFSAATATINAARVPIVAVDHEIENVALYKPYATHGSH